MLRFLSIAPFELFQIHPQGTTSNDEQNEMVNFKHNTAETCSQQRSIILGSHEETEDTETQETAATP